MSGWDSSRLACTASTPTSSQARRARENTAEWPDNVMWYWDQANRRRFALGDFGSSARDSSADLLTQSQSSYRRSPAAMRCKAVSTAAGPRRSGGDRVHSDTEAPSFERWPFLIKKEEERKGERGGRGRRGEKRERKGSLASRAIAPRSSEVGLLSPILSLSGLPQPPNSATSLR